MKDTAIHTTTDAVPTFLKGRPWLPALVCTALIICAAALPCLADEPDGPAEERAAEQPAPAEAAPAAAEPADASEPDLPRHEDGTINYYQVLVDRYSAGVTPENNGAVPLVLAMGPKVFDEKIREEALAQLGLSDLPEDGPYFEPLYKYYDRTVPFDEQEDYDRFAFLDEIASRPWSAAEYPIAAAWLEANEGPLALIVEAIQRSHFYMPKISPNDPPTLLSAFLPELAWSRYAAYALTGRAMLKLDAGDVEGAWQDVLAVRRLARQVGNGPFLIDMLVGLGIDGIAIDAGKTILASGSPTPDQLQAMLSDMLALPPVQSLAECFETERLFMLDAVEAFKRGPSEDVASWLGDEDVDWEAVRGAAERWYDRSIAAATASDYAEHLRLTEELDADLDQFVEDFPVDVPDPVEKHEWLSMLRPEFSRIRTVTEMREAEGDLFTLSLAARLYLARNDQYPVELEQLMPDCLPEIPVDGFTGEAMKYVRTDDGCKVYSVGPNMIDDGGFNYDDIQTMQGDSEDDVDFDAVMPEGMTEDADDIVIELGRVEQ